MAFKLPEKYRQKHPLLGLGDQYGGFFIIPVEDGEAYVIASNGMGWEHVSVHIISERIIVTPMWEEMCNIKAIFWDKEDCVLQFHPPESEYVNNHPNVLHLWRPIDITVAMPPSILVGLKAQ